jgi:hypothetical protein
MDVSDAAFKRRRADNRTDEMYRCNTKTQDNEKYS